MHLASDRHFEASVTLSTAAIARRLPHTLTPAARHTDRRAVLALAACQIGTAVLTATALAATTRVLAAVFTGPDIATGLRDNLPALAVLTLAACGRYLCDAAARAAAARLAPKAVREADLQVITAATTTELAAYEDPDFEDAHAAASDGAEKTGDLILDAQLLTSAAAQMAAAATVVTVLHPAMLPLLVLSVIPCAWGPVRGARVEHAAHRRNLADSRLRSVFRSYTTERNTADEVRARRRRPPAPGALPHRGAPSADALRRFPWRAPAGLEVLRRRPAGPRSALLPSVLRARRRIRRHRARRVRDAHDGHARGSSCTGPSTASVWQRRD
ncbi:hypothetical protein ACH4TE_01925 [Streptomyces sioyaensis]|uniref:hypothetical protein n=1 Tax=Streptomyces sioyaensis TaxID=67364 RepID=UPI0037B0441F